MRAAWRRAWTRARAARARPPTACTARWAPCTSLTACSSPVLPRAGRPFSHVSTRTGRMVAGLLLASASCAWAGAAHTTDVDGGEGTHAGQCRAGGRPRRGLPGPARGVSAGASPRGASAGARRAQARPRRCTSRGWSARPRWRARRRAARCRTPSPRRRRRRSRARWRAWRSGCCSATTRRRAQRAAARAHAPRASYRDA